VNATWGCVDCKKVLMESLTRFLTPIHERRKALEADPDRLWHILEQGNARARQRAAESMEAVRKALNFNF
jgi:tryptophanyl-tRNA synthetase